MFKLYTILTTSTGLDLPHDLSTKFKHEPENWHTYYETKSLALKETDHDVLISQGNKEYKEALKLLRERREEINHSMLVMVASKMLWLLGEGVPFFLHQVLKKRKTDPDLIKMRTQVMLEVIIY